MKRKVMKHGPSSLTISLPIAWTRLHNIDKGDEISLQERDGTLTLYPGPIGNQECKRTTLDVTSLDQATIHSLLSVLHKTGYDEIYVRFSQPNLPSFIQERVNSMLMGYEIIEQKNDHIIIRQVSGDLWQDFEGLVRRSFLLTLALAKNAQEQLERLEKDKLRELLVLESTNNKITNYCERLINKKSYKEAKDIFKYLIVWTLESICDDYRDLIRDAIAGRIRKLQKQEIAAYADASSLLEEYYDLYYSYDDTKLMAIRRKLTMLKDDLHAKDCYQRAVSSRLGSVVARLIDCLGSTAGLHH